LRQDGFPCANDILVNKIDGGFLKKEDLNEIYGPFNVSGILPYDKEVSDFPKPQLLGSGKAKCCFIMI
jgi:hypothetical protein